MANLLISKINGIQVIQIDESKLTVDNKKADSNKPSNPLEENSGGNNSTVDLGAGTEKHTLKFVTFDKNETSTLYDILKNIRYCTVTDKFFGKLNVYIERIALTNSDKHVGKTVFDITATVQDAKSLPVEDKTAQLASAIDSLEDEVVIASSNFADSVDTTDKVLDVASNTKSYFDTLLSTLEDGLTNLVDLGFVGLDFFNGIKAKANRIKRIGDRLDTIINIPQNFIDLVAEMLTIETEKIPEIYIATASTGEQFIDLDSDFSNLSQIEREALQKEVRANTLLNMIIATGEMKQILTKSFKSQKEFDDKVETAITRLDYTGMDYTQKINAQQILKGYSNTKAFNKIINFEVKEEAPLVAIVFELYGNLDFYEDIRILNGFADNDAIIGTLKVFDESVS